MNDDEIGFVDKDGEENVNTGTDFNEFDGDIDQKDLDGELPDLPDEKPFVDKDNELNIHAVRIDEKILGFKVDLIYPPDQIKELYGEKVDFTQIGGEERYRFLNLWHTWFRARELKWYLAKALYVSGYYSTITQAFKDIGVDINGTNKNVLGNLTAGQKWREMRKRVLMANGGKPLTNPLQIMFLYFTFIIRELLGLSYSTLDYFTHEYNYGFSITFRHQKVKLIKDDVLKEIEAEMQKEEKKEKENQVVKTIDESVVRKDLKTILNTAQTDYFKMLEIIRSMIMDVVAAKSPKEAETEKAKVQALSILANMYRDILRIPPAPKPEQFSIKKAKKIVDVKPIDL